LHNAVYIKKIQKNAFHYIKIELKFIKIIYDNFNMERGDVMSVLFCDSDCELWFDEIEKLKIDYFKMPYTLDGVETFYDMGKSFDVKHFYDRVREGSMPITSALNPEIYENIIEPIFKRGEDILYIAFGRNYSATFNYLDIALANLKKKYPERKMTIFDTKMISLPTGIQVKYAAELKNKGATDEEIISFLKEFTNHVCCYIAVNNLKHLHRGGRLSKASAIFGSLLKIKPVLTFDEYGKLSVIEKVKGSKNVARYIGKKAAEGVRETDKYDIYIMHADNIEGAQMVEKIIRDAHPEANIRIQPVGPVVGTHCGPDTIAVIYYGDQRVVPLKVED